MQYYGENGTIGLIIVEGGMPPEMPDGPMERPWATVESTDTPSAKGLKAGTLLRLHGGALTLDCADDALHSNGDVVIIAMANNLEASVMAVTLCKEIGVKTVIAKCANEMHQKILTRVGADKVVFPENESGIRLAKNLLSSGFVDMVSLAKNVSMVELDVKPEWVGKNLIQLNLRKKYSINVVALRRENMVSVDIDPNAPLQGNDKLIVITNPEKLSKLR